jgi:hypothetical protein
LQNIGCPLTKTYEYLKTVEIVRGVGILCQADDGTKLKGSDKRAGSDEGFEF